MNKIKLRLLEIKNKIKEIRLNYNLELYKYTMEYYTLKKKLDKNYTILKLGIDLEIPHTTIYRLMAYRNSTPYIKNCVKTGKITFCKACDILQRVPAEQYDDTIKKAIDNNVTIREIRKELDNQGLSIKHIISKREYKSNWNIERDILNGLTRLKRPLIAIKKANNKEKILSELIKFRRILNNAIEKLR